MLIVTRRCFDDTPGRRTVQVAQRVHVNVVRVNEMGVAPRAIRVGLSASLASQGGHAAARRDLAKADTRLRACSGCLVARYCCDGCLCAAWPAHKEECRRLQALRESKTAVMPV